jgi:hypothetical protein
MAIYAFMKLWGRKFRKIHEAERPKGTSSAPKPKGISEKVLALVNGTGLALYNFELL